MRASSHRENEGEKWVKNLHEKPTESWAAVALNPAHLGNIKINNRISYSSQPSGRVQIVRKFNVHTQNFFAGFPLKILINVPLPPAHLQKLKLSAHSETSFHVFWTHRHNCESLGEEEKLSCGCRKIEFFRVCSFLLNVESPREMNQFRLFSTLKRSKSCTQLLHDQSQELWNLSVVSVDFTVGFTFLEVKYSK